MELDITGRGALVHARGCFYLDHYMRLRGQLLGLVMQK